MKIIVVYRRGAAKHRADPPSEVQLSSEIEAFRWILFNQPVDIVAIRIDPAE